MRCRIPRIAVIPALSAALILCLVSGLYAGAVLFHGKTVNIDLSDLEIYSGDPDETAVKAICAEN